MSENSTFETQLNEAFRIYQGLQAQAIEAKVVNLPATDYEIELYLSGSKIPAIKRLKDRTGCGLVQAKDSLQAAASDPKFMEKRLKNMTADRDKWMNAAQKLADDKYDALDRLGAAEGLIDILDSKIRKISENMNKEFFGAAEQEAIQAKQYITEYDDKYSR